MTNIPKQETLGERLKKRREYLGFSADDIMSRAQISAIYLDAFEHDCYDALPSRIYARGYLKKFFAVLSFSAEEEKRYFEEFNKNFDLYASKKEHLPLPKLNKKAFSITSKEIGFGVLGILLLSFLIFLGLRFLNFTGSPRLMLEEPRDGERIMGSVVHIRGTTEKESQLTVNGRELTIDEIGIFEEEIELPLGTNTLDFRVKNRFGKETSTVRHIVVE